MTTKIVLDDADLPASWYNILADMPRPPRTPLHPATQQPVGPDDLAPLFAMDLIKQEVSRERFIAIPDAVRAIYSLWRPTPLYRAQRLERALGTPAQIYYKYEGVSPAGSHKPNTAVAQAYYAQKAGTKRLTTETGAGQWGSALALACSFVGLACKVYMVRISYEQKPYRRSVMQAWGATVVPSPSAETVVGRRIRAEHPDALGSLGIAISEAVEDAATQPDTNYALGSVLNHVLLHQTVIGQEAQAAMARLGVYPDVVIGCVGGGSNFGGLALPYVRDKIAGKDVRIVAVEPSACPSLTRGVFAYDHGDTGGLTPLLPMHTLGHTFVPAGIHAGGLRYHGMSPIVSQLYNDGLIEARAYPQLDVFDAALRFARSEAIIPAPEAAHAIKAVIDEALRCKEEGKQETILFNLSGHGNFDMAAYDAYFAGQLEDFTLPQEEIQRALRDIEGLPLPATT
jgi:tryptophan synthase beta chain